MISIESRALLLLLVTAAGAAGAKKKTLPPPSDTQRVIMAAGTCTPRKGGMYLEAPTPDKVKALIASGISISALDSNGFDALSGVSLLRKNRNKRKADDWWTLNCPKMVTTLTEAGADPWKAKFYQNPRFNEKYRSKMIAVITDNKRGQDLLF